MGIKSPITPPITLYARVAEVSVERYSESTAIKRNDVVALEEPLQIALIYHKEGHPTRVPVALTMRTPGDDAHLALGLLYAEGIIQAMADVVHIETQSNNGRDKPFATEITLALHPDIAVDEAAFARRLPSTSSCGVCGRLSLPTIKSQAFSQTELTLEPETLYALTNRARSKQTLFKHTGGIHSAAFFSREGTLIDLAEDIGRHNALDKLIGRALAEGQHDLANRVLLLSGRVSYELMQKTIAAGIRCVVAIGAPSSLAVEMARTYGVTLVGFMKVNRFNVYAGAQRIVPPISPEL